MEDAPEEIPCIPDEDLQHAIPSHFFDASYWRQFDDGDHPEPTGDYSDANVGHPFGMPSIRTRGGMINGTTLLGTIAS